MCSFIPPVSARHRDPRGSSVPFSVQDPSRCGTSGPSRAAMRARNRGGGARRFYGARPRRELGADGAITKLVRRRTKDRSRPARGKQTCRKHLFLPVRGSLITRLVPSRSRGSLKRLLSANDGRAAFPGSHAAGHGRANTFSAKHHYSPRTRPLNRVRRTRVTSSRASYVYSYNRYVYRAIARLRFYRPKRKK